MSRITWQRMAALLVAPLFALAGLVAIAMPVQAAVSDYVEVGTRCIEGEVVVNLTNISDEELTILHGSSLQNSLSIGAGNGAEVPGDGDTFNYAVESTEEVRFGEGEVDLSGVCSSDGDNAGDETDDVTPVTIDGCKVTVPALQGVSYFQDKGNDPMLDAGVYDAKYFYPSTTFTAHLGTQGEPKLGEWTIDVPKKCAPASDEPAEEPAEDPVTPTRAPASGM